MLHRSFCECHPRSWCLGEAVRCRQTPAVDIFVRDHLMDTGRYIPSVAYDGTYALLAAFDDLYQGIKLGDILWWDNSPDIKVDSPTPTYQMNIEDVDYVKFETNLYHNPVLTAHVNRIYVQIHNRGIKAAANVTIQVFYANIVDTPSGVPDLPQDFWTSYPRGSSDKSGSWKPIGEAKILPSPPITLTNTEPTVLAWEWNTPPDITDYVCLLLVIDSPEDPIPDSIKKMFTVDQIVPSEKHIAIMVVDVIRPN